MTGPRKFTIGYFVGSLSEASINRRLAEVLIRLSPRNLEFVEISIGDLPLYNRDLDGDYPEVATSLKRSIEGVDGILFVTPEYNRDIPGSLKNAIDWGSRPWGTNSFARKPVAVIGASPGKIGTAVAQSNLRSVLSFLNAPQMNWPEAYIQITDGFFDANGKVADASTAEFLQAYMTEFSAFVGRVLEVLPNRGIARP